MSASFDFNTAKVANERKFGFVSRPIAINNAANGYDAQDLLQDELLKLRQSGDVAVVVRRFRAGDPNATNYEQFYAPLMVQFHDMERWIIFTSTSCRTDRIKGQLWDAENLKRLDTSIEMAFLAYPDDALSKEVSAFERQKEKYDSGEEISSLDDVIPFSELLDRVQKRAAQEPTEEVSQEESVDDASEAADETDWNDSFQTQEDESSSDVADAEPIPATTTTSQTNLFDDREFLDAAQSDGWLFDFKGRAFEKDVATNLSNGQYLTFWKADEPVGTDAGYAAFHKMVSTFGLQKESVRKIDASAEKEVIGLLPSGGQPKTDVVAKVSMCDGSTRDITISCKRTTLSSVSVHQYTADAFADVLDKNNQQLRMLLKEFQFFHNIKGMSPSHRSLLTHLLSPLKRKLCEWVLAGYGYEVSSDIQYANYLVVYKPNERYFAAHSVDDYIDLLLRRNPLSFGTPFSWTFASKQGGKSIQLKLPIVK